MSVYGGDSWAREAQYRKRRVDDLIVESTLSGGGGGGGGGGCNTYYKKLRSGKYACLVCPHNPVLDTPLLLSIHMKTPQHCAAETRAKERELERQNEINKRIALSQNSSSIANSNSASKRQCKEAGKPLIERTRKAALEVLENSSPQENTSFPTKEFKSNWGMTTSVHFDYNNGRSLHQIEATAICTVQLPLDYRERKEKELKFTAAGWKRDCHGGWFRDENVEFDSDEEDPNVSLA